MAKRKTPRPQKSSGAASAPAATARAGGGWRNDDLTPLGRWAWWVLLATVILVPLTIGSLRFVGIDATLLHDIFDTGKVFILRIGATAALLLWAIDTVRNGGTVRYSPVLWVLLAFVGWSALSTLLSIEPGTSFFGKYRRYDGVWSYAIYATLTFLMLQYANRPARIKQVAQAVCAVSVPVALYGLAQSAGIEPMRYAQLSFEANRSFSTYGNPDLLAGFLAFGIFVSVGLALAEHDTRWRIGYWLAVLLSLAVSITAFSRSIWVGAVVGALAVAVFAWRQRARWSAVDWGMSGATVAAAGAFAVASLSSENAVMNFAKRVVSIFEFDSGSASTRFMIWNSAAQAAGERPLFGFGPDTFRMVFRRFQPAEYAQLAGPNSVADNVHNYPLQLAASVGIPGAILFYATIAWGAIVSARTLWALPDAGTSEAAATSARDSKLVMVGLWAASAAFVTHLMFGLALPASAFLLFICAGALLAPTARSVRVQPLAGWYGTLAGVSAATLAVALIALASTQLYADNRYAYGSQRTSTAQAQFNAGQGEAALVSLQQSIVDLRAASNLAPSNDHYRYTLFANEAWLSLVAAQQGDPAAPALVEDAVALGRELLASNPWEYDNVTFVINYYNQLADVEIFDYLEEARALAEENILLAPNGPTLRYAYAGTLVRMSQFDLATEQLEYILGQVPRYEDAQRLLDEIRQRTESGEL